MARRAVAVFAVSVVGTTLLVLSGCSSSKPSPPPCPSVLVLSEASSMTRFVPGRGTDLLDIDFQAEISDLLSGCKIQRPGKPGATMAVTLAPILVVSRGAANGDGRADFSYFVSVIDGNDHIVNKQDFPVGVTFEGNRNTVVVREDESPISVDIPLTPGVNPLDYEIIVGLQLTQSQLEYNRDRRAAVR